MQPYSIPSTVTQAVTDLYAVPQPMPLTIFKELPRAEKHQLTIQKECATNQDESRCGIPESILLTKPTMMLVASTTKTSSFGKTVHFVTKPITESITRTSTAAETISSE